MVHPYLHIQKQNRALFAKIMLSFKSFTDDLCENQIFFVKTLFHYLEEKGYVTYSTQAGSGVSPERACLRCQAPGFFRSSEEFASLCPPEGNQE